MKFKLGLAAALLGVGCAVALGLKLKGTGAEPAPLPAATSLAALVGTPAGDVAAVPIERMNLLCAQGLSASGPDIEPCLETLQTWARRVQSETERHRYRFRQNPGEFEHSEGFFCMLMLAVVLAEDFGVHYHTQYQVEADAARMDDGFFAQPENVFLHGLLGSGRQGTCSSLPVLYVALGRQLGYPLKLATTKGHLFVRWEGAGERFNVEATSHGLNRFSDDYYRHWPFEVSAAEEATEGYLKSLSPAEELAVFLSIRGMCLREAGRQAEAAESFAGALRLAPGCASYRQVLATLQPNLSSGAGAGRVTGSVKSIDEK